MYAIMAYVCVAVMPNFYEIDNLATVAGQFMGQGMLVFFICGGALLAVVTSINSAMLMFSRINFAAARDGLFPYAVCKTNKHNAPVVSLWLIAVMTFPAITTVTGSPLAGGAAMLIGIVCAWCGMGLLPVSLLCCGSVMLLQAVL